MTTTRVGLVGLGYIGRIHAAAARASAAVDPSGDQPQLAYTALLTTHPDGRLDAAARVGIGHVYADLDRFLAKAPIDAVDVCTPNAQHPAVVRAALARGLAVYCEKPLAATLADARAMTQAAARAPGAETPSKPTAAAPSPPFNMVALVMRFRPAVQWARAHLRAGTIGRIHTVRAHIFHSSYLDPDRPTAWRLRRAASGGGALADLGTHLVDQLLYLLGDITEVRAQTRTFIANRPADAGSAARVPVDVDDWARLELAFASGAVGSLEVSRMAAGADGWRVQIFGSSGSLAVADDDPYRPHLHVAGQTTPSTDEARLDAGERAITLLYPPAKYSLGGLVDGHLAALRRFGLGVQRGDDLPVPGVPDFAAALRAQEVVDAAYRSADGGGGWQAIGGRRA